MRLEDGDQPAGRRESAVEGRDRGGLAALGAMPDVEPTGLVGHAVTRAGEFAVRPLRRNPGLDVELSRRTRAEVTRGNVDHPVAEAARLQHRLLIGQKLLVLGLGLIRKHVGEHLQLVELVNAQDATVVAPGRTGLPAIAGRPSRIPQRPVG